MQIEAAKLDELSQCVLERKKGFYEKFKVTAMFLSTTKKLLNPLEQIRGKIVSS